MNELPLDLREDGLYLCRLHNESASRLPRTGDFILQKRLDSYIYVFYH